MGAMALTFQTHQTLRFSSFPAWSLIFTFSATVFIYCLHRLIGQKPYQDFLLPKTPPEQTFFQNILQYSAICSFLLAGYSFFKLRPESQLYLIVPGILTILYCVPLLRRQKRLRDIGVLKIFLLATVWTWATVVLPFSEASIPLQTEHFILFAERWLLVFAVSVPFDIRDMQYDKASKVLTLPVLIGKSSSIILSKLSLLLMGACSLWLRSSGVYSWASIVAIVVSSAICWKLIDRSVEAQTEMLYFAGLDGIFIWLPISMAMAHFFR